MAEINKNCLIYNNSETAIIVLDSYNKNAADTDILYECIPTVLNTTSGKKIIEASASDSVTLNNNIPDVLLRETNDDVYSTYYQLILAKPENLFPVKYVDEVLSYSSKSYPDINVEKIDSFNINLAFQLYQMLLAYPTSTLAKQFYLALNNAFSEGKSAEEIETIIANFLKTTEDYKTLDAATYAAVMSYIESYPNIFAVNKFYYVYSPNSNGDGPIYQGRLIFTLKTPTPEITDPTDPNGGYEISFFYANGNVKNLNYKQRQCVSSTSEDFPSICLEGSFINKRYLSMNEEDNQIIPIWIGVIDGIQVLGTTFEQGSNVVPIENNFFSLWHPTTFSEWMVLITSLLSLFFAIGLTVIGVRLLVGRIRSYTAKLRAKTQDDNTFPSDEEVNSIRTGLREAMNGLHVQTQQRYDSLTPNSSEAPRTSIPDNENEYETISNDEVYSTRSQLSKSGAQAALDGLEKVYSNLETLAGYTVNEELEIIANDTLQAAQSIREWIPEINQAQTSGDFQAIEEVLGKIPSILENSRALLAEGNRITEDIALELGQKLSEEQRATLNTNKEVAELCEKMALDAEKTETIVKENEIDEEVKPIEIL